MLSPPDSSNKPTYNANSVWQDPTGSYHAVVCFDGSNDSLSGSIGTALSGSDKPYTLAVAFMLDNTSTRGTIASIFATDPGTDTSIDYAGSSTSPSEYDMYRLTPGGSAQQKGGSLDTSKHIMVKVFKGTSVEVFIDNVQIITSSYDTDSADFTKFSLASQRGTSIFADVNIVECCLWSKEFSSSECTDVYDTILSRWF